MSVQLSTLSSMKYEQQAINDAMSMGWNQLNALGVFKGMDAMVLDKQFWICLGKAKGWKSLGVFKQPGDIEMHEYMLQWYALINWLIDDKDYESFFKALYE